MTGLSTNWRGTASGKASQMFCHGERRTSLAHLTGLVLSVAFAAFYLNLCETTPAQETRGPPGLPLRRAP
jgi:hypothetical protein